MAGGNHAIFQLSLVVLLVLLVIGVQVGWMKYLSRRAWDPRIKSPIDMEEDRVEKRETHLKKESLEQQDAKIKETTSNHNTYNSGSHVMEYAILKQKDVEVMTLWGLYETAKGSKKKAKALKEIRDMVMFRKHLDSSVDMIAMLLFGPEKGRSIVGVIRAQGLPIVDDLDCLESMVRLFKTCCGPLKDYGLKHVTTFANFCNNGVSEAAMAEASMLACGGRVHEVF